MRTWVRPMAVEENYTADQAVANNVTTCYLIACDVGRPNNNAFNYSNGPNWNGNEYGNVYHSTNETGTCSDAYANRVLSNGMKDGSTVSENNKKQGWIYGTIDTIIDNGDNVVGPGDRVYWHTFDENKNRRWNHTGVIKAADPNLPNHS